jgi:type II secretory pathway pseudopilin PulG
MVELLVVLLIMSVLTVFALIYAYPHQKLYKPDDQSLLITDVLQEARQRSLTQNETLRVEISKTRGLVRLIEENSPATADDDVLRKQVALFAEAEVRYTEEPSDVDYNPPEPLEPADAVFQNSVYTGSIGEEVCTLRFLGNGTVTNAGNNSVGTGATPTGVTLQIWSPKKAPDETEFEILRAITVIGTTGVIRLWEFNPALERANKWQDSRRYGTYGTVSGATPTPTP